MMINRRQLLLAVPALALPLKKPDAVQAEDLPTWDKPWSFEPMFTNPEWFGLRDFMAQNRERLSYLDINEIYENLRRLYDWQIADDTDDWGYSSEPGEMTPLYGDEAQVVADWHADTCRDGLTQQDSEAYRAKYFTPESEISRLGRKYAKLLGRQTVEFTKQDNIIGYYSYPFRPMKRPEMLIPGLPYDGGHIQRIHAHLDAGLDPSAFFLLFKDNYPEGVPQEWQEFFAEAAYLKQLRINNDMILGDVTTRIWRTRRE